MSDSRSSKDTGHEHTNGTCPVTGTKASDSIPYAFCPAQANDIRSVCPALNTMANHGYIRRDGKDLTAGDISKGLKACYGLSGTLSAFLSYVGFILLGKLGQRITLHDISRHGKIEHDASIVHHDTPEGELYAPKEIDLALADKVLDDIQPRKDNLKEGDTWLFGTEDMGRVRVRRERECRPIGTIAREIARGEMSIIMQAWGQTSGGKTGAPVEWVRRWLTEERLPEGWKPDRVVGLGMVAKQSKAIRLAAAEIRKQEAAAAAEQADKKVSAKL